MSSCLPWDRYHLLLLLLCARGLAGLGIPAVWAAPALELHSGTQERPYPQVLKSVAVGGIQLTNSALSGCANSATAGLGEISRIRDHQWHGKNKWSGRIQWQTWQNHRYW